MIALALFIGYIACSVLAYGLFLADWAGTFPDRSPAERAHDRGACVMFSLLGPLSLLAAFFATGFGYHGLRFR